ncbi:MAG: hypothetical protein N4A53_12135 [Pelagimonas sp.]|nr:hypothetical protein [Pelagimonas sp.]
MPEGQDVAERYPDQRNNQNARRCRHRRDNRNFLLSPEGNKSYWSKIAVAWAHKDGQGFNVQMDAVPVDGKLVLRTVPEDHEGTGEMIEPSPE